MASRSTSLTPRSKSQRGGETDGSKTSQTVKSTTNISGDKSHKSTEQHKSPRTPCPAERRLSAGRNSELQQTLEALAKSKEQLASAEEAKAQALEELANTKKLTEELSIKLNEVLDTSKRERSRADEIEHASFTAAEDWQAELEAMKRQYEEEVNDLQTTKQALENLKQELFTSLDAKNEAVKLAGEAMSAAEAAAKRAEELSAELVAAKSSLTTGDAEGIKVQELMSELSAAKEGLREAHATNEKILQEGAAILAAKEATLRETFEVIEQTKVETDGLKHELAVAKELELEVTYMKSLVENLKDELILAKNLESNMSLAAADAHFQLENAIVELEQAKMAESEALASLASVNAELEEARENLRCALEESGTLMVSLSSVQKQLERNEIELAKMKEKELSAATKASDLNKELNQFQKQLADAMAAERKARGTIQSLTLSLHVLKAEAEQAKQELLSTKAAVDRERELAAAAQAEAFMARDKSQTARNKTEIARAAAEQAALEAKEAKLEAEGARAELEGAKAEAEEAREETEKEIAEAKLAKKEVLAAQEQLQMALRQAQEVQAELQIEREEANDARDKTRAALSRVEELEAELEKTHLNLEGASMAAMDAERRLGDALKEMEMAKGTSELTVEVNKEVSETWDTAESEHIVCIAVSQEYDNMKAKLQEAETFVAVAMAEVKETKGSKEELARKLESVNKEIEVNKQGALQAQQQLEEAEKARLDLETEVQKLRSDIKRQQKSMDMAERSPHNSGVNGSAIPAFSEEKQLQLDILSQVPNTSICTSHKNDDHKEQVLSLASKKKKRALLLRIGTYLAKMKNH